MKKVLKVKKKAKGNNMTVADARRYAFSAHSQDFCIDDGENLMLHPSAVDNALEAIHALHKAGDLSYAMLLACKLVDGYRAFYKKMTEWRGADERDRE